MSAPVPATECAAVRIAAHLRHRHGHGALGRATAWRTDALRRRDGVRADLYLAVCIVLEDSLAVFSRSRASAHTGPDGSVARHRPDEAADASACLLAR